jgi:hypothetical protein
MKRLFLVIIHMFFLCVFLNGTTFLFPSFSHAEPCKGDIDNNSTVDGSDLSDLANDFGATDCTPKPPAPVSKTGQATCYDSSANVIDCTGTGQDGDLQKGIWPTPRFKINGDGTVTDNMTGLMWLQDTNCMPDHYPEFDEDNTAGDGKVTWQHALDFVAGINDRTYPDCGSGYTDWRLPNLKEFLSLIHYGYAALAIPDTVGTGHCTGNGDPFLGPNFEYHWSSTTALMGRDHAWSVWFISGGIYEHLKYNNYHLVWPVRGGQ